MSKRSPSLADKLNARFAPDREVINLVATATSPRRFDSQRDFAANLAEGSLLNVSVIASRALSVPQGEYMVWMTDAGHTMLVPTNEKHRASGVYEHNNDAFEVQTRDLMANWNRLERVLAEDATPPGNGNLEEPEGEAGDEEEGKAGEFRSTIDASTVDRTPIMRAMQDRGYTVTSLANEVGVDPPAISRILRTPKDTPGDPGGRNPSMGLASQICNVLRIDPTAAFPDIFNANDRYQARQQPGNDGSGSSGNKGNSKWTQGSVGEDRELADARAILEASDGYRNLCQSLASGAVPLDPFTVASSSRPC